VVGRGLGGCGVHTMVYFGSGVGEWYKLASFGFIITETLNWVDKYGVHVQLNEERGRLPEFPANKLYNNNLSPDH